ncbi:hypothetical protein OG481_09715 [Streptomyces longwoodensis]|uniref:hypothetical protein n=1 Tax=Streptomyces longwoodensis TaxID=68231 RepID=UPI002DD818C3|nr:hypothetical protein [Streptomyces longwoodensis]WRY88793.1 hypothetical protein OG481_09715 [Streptomyces longwoodensis]
MSTPPPVGKSISVKVDAQLYDDLTTMLATGMTVSDAVRSALRIVAGTYRKVWDHTDVPYGTRPTIDRWFIRRYDAGQHPEPGSIQTSVPTAYWDRTTPRPTDAPPRTTACHTAPHERPTTVRQAR